MLFRRRQPLSLASRVRTVLWPRSSFSRSFHYFRKRVLRLNATPHAIAAGFAAGVAASFTPFIGFHFLLAFALAYVVAGNMASAALGTVVGNPLTFPFIWGVTYEVGHWLLGARAPHGEAPANLGSALRHMDFAAIWKPIIEPMMIGALPLGLGAGLLSYGLVFAAARSFQAHRAHRMAGLKHGRQRSELRLQDARRDGSFRP
ncbi:DUF2062 domain-containing protein [Aurantimonas sp. VKM B-3413]|nr:DUF2062 domain-containing protein [Aurantimonas sp. VKM B-3413]MCB8836049.1 DUF2062 domain-containing protein [Aurantimonas sp. VKM B-3413]